MIGSLENDKAKSTVEDIDENDPLKGFDYRRYVLAFIRKWRVIAVVFVLLCGLGLFAGISLRGKTFSAKAVLLYTDPFQGNGSPESQTYRLPEIDLPTLVSTVKLPKNIEKVISQLGLNVTPVRFSEQIDLEVQRGSDIIAIEGIGSSPKQAADIANLTIDAFLASHKELRKKEAQTALERYNAQLVSLEKQFAEVADAMEVYRKEKGIGHLASEAEFYRTRKSELVGELEQSRMALKEIESQIEETNKKIERGPGSDRDSAPKSRARYNEIRSELARLKVLYTADHPRIIQLEEELSLLRRQKGGNSVARHRTRLGTLNGEKEKLELKVSIIGESLEQLNGKMEELTGVEKSQGRLVEKKQMIKNSISTISAERQGAAELVKHQPVEFSILERAQPPEHASSSKAKIVALIIPVVGLFLLFAGILIGEFRDKSIKTPKELSSGLDVNVLAVHPHHPGYVDKSEILIELGPYEIAVSSLYANDILKTHKTVGVVSILPQTGQSTVAENLAQVLGQRGKSVVVMRQVSSSSIGKGGQGDLQLQRGTPPEDAEYKMVEFGSLGQLLQKFSSYHKKNVAPVQAPPTEVVPDDARSTLLLHGAKNAEREFEPHARQNQDDYVNGRFEEPSAYDQSSASYEEKRKAIFDHVIVDPQSLYVEPKVIELFSEIDISIIAVRAGKTQKRHLESLVAQLKNLGTNLVGAVLIDADICFCDEQIRMSVGDRPVFYGKDPIERFFAKKFLVS